MFTFCIVGIIVVPLLIYVVGLLIPASHIVSRTATYNITPERLWEILTDVENYPSWQPKVERVEISQVEEEEEGGSEGKKVVFVQHSHRKSKSVIVHVERAPFRTLLRILEERLVDTNCSVPSRKPTFSGSWTFEIIPQRVGDKEVMHDTTSTTPSVSLKITEQGIIKKPMVRVTHLLLFGFHLRIDRFLKDLAKKIEGDNNTLVTMEEKRQLPLENGGDQEDLADDLSLSPSKIIDKDWDLISEIYERKAT
ncbi:hypothetical protein EC973_009101 [Apophysomyces ossiformis]|uniref:Uncharacterized protein n=1 Tax=Apophysomyces ossiformis TaxID=679940 RepID=A0A8H7BM14_9FUNG|nr:hypothetical protein EC973_009101 [Apophysomyces ossiformis]